MLKLPFRKGIHTGPRRRELVLPRIIIMEYQLDKGCHSVYIAGRVHPNLRVVGSE